VWPAARSESRIRLSEDGDVRSNSRHCRRFLEYMGPRGARACCVDVGVYVGTSKDARTSMDESRCIEKEGSGPLASPLCVLRKWEVPHSSHSLSAWSHPLDCLQQQFGPATSVPNHLTLTNDGLT